MMSKTSASKYPEVDFCSNRSKCNKSKELTCLLNKFKKPDLISNFFKESHNKYYDTSKTKKNIIEEAIYILSKKFSDLDELTLYLHLKYIFTQKVGRVWTAFEVVKPKRLVKDIRIDNVSDYLLKYFSRYGIPCKVITEKKGNCIWMVLYLGNVIQKPTYLVAHTKLSAVFINSSKTNLPIVQKVILKAFRGESLKDLSVINANVEYIQNLNNNFLIKNAKAGVNKKKIRKERTNTSGCEIDEIFVEYDSHVRRRSPLKDSKNLDHLQRRKKSPEKNSKHCHKDKKSPQKISKNLEDHQIRQQYPQTNSVSDKIICNVRESPEDSFEDFEDNHRSGKSSQKNSKNLVRHQRNPKSPQKNIKVNHNRNRKSPQNSPKNIKDRLRKRSTQNNDENFENNKEGKHLQENSKSIKVHPRKREFPKKNLENPVDHSSRQHYQKNLEDNQRKRKFLEKNAKISEDFKRARRSLPKYSENFEDYQTKEKFQDKNSESSTDHQRKKKVPQKNSDLPKIDRLMYYMKSSTFGGEELNSNSYSVCAIEFKGTHVLKGLNQLANTGIANVHLPDYLSEKPRSGQTEFVMTM